MPLLQVDPDLAPDDIEVGREPWWLFGPATGHRRAAGIAPGHGLCGKVRQVIADMA